MRPERLWTIPSILSASRIVLSIPIAYCVTTDFPGSRLWAAALLAIGIASDFLDGYLARRLHLVTEFGKVIDPVADKVGVAVIFGALVASGDVALWEASVIIGRDLVLLAGAVYIRREKRITVQSNWPGKIAVTAIAVLGLVSMLRLPSLEGFRAVTLWFTMFMIALSLAMYTQRLFIGRQRSS